MLNSEIFFIPLVMYIRISTPVVFPCCSKPRLSLFRTMSSPSSNRNLKYYTHRHFASSPFSSQCRLSQCFCDFLTHRILSSSPISWSAMEWNAHVAESLACIVLVAGPGLFCRTGTTSSVRSGFAGTLGELTSAIRVHATSGGGGNGSRSVVTMDVKPMIQFIRGVEERVVPDVKLTRSKDGTNGVAKFRFDQPSVFDSSQELGDITGLYMLDEEGTLFTVDVSAKFLNGKPAGIECQYVMRSRKDWDRFMRFMERYAKENQLGFVKS